MIYKKICAHGVKGKNRMKETVFTRMKAWVAYWEPQDKVSLTQKAMIEYRQDYLK